MTIECLNWRSELRRGALLPWSRPFAHRGGRAQELLESFAAYCGGTILDVGAGGNAPVFAERFGERYQALDFSSSYKLKTEDQRRALTHVVEAGADAASIPFEDRSYDAVLCLDVLEHVDEIHSFYAELFRVARRHLVVSLPNNWPNFLWSLVAGRNITHRAGYGLGVTPRGAGERHKHFFNLEEACEFLVCSRSAEFVCRRLDFRFEHGSDGLLVSIPVVTRYARQIGKARLADYQARFGAAGPVLWATANALYLPFRALDVAVSALAYGWGSRIRYYNLFCRQAWAVFERIG